VAVVGFVADAPVIDTAIVTTLPSTTGDGADDISTCVVDIAAPYISEKNNNRNILILVWF
jgi:hypothetical protein